MRCLKVRGGQLGPIKLINPTNIKTFQISKSLAKHSSAIDTKDQRLINVKFSIFHGRQEKLDAQE